MDGAFIAAMEAVLYLYSLVYDPKKPVLCFDERPCFLIGDHVKGLEMKPGKVRKEDYSYTKHGSACLLAAIEPLTGKRFTKVYKQRTKKEYTDFMRYLASQYPAAEEIQLVQDNLNTHTKGAFYDNLPAQQAFGLAQKFRFTYTPKHASWLNMIEIEFSAISRQALDKRIPTIEGLEAQVSAIVKERNEKKIGIDWQFSISDARDKLSRHYEKTKK